MLNWGRFNGLWAAIFAMLVALVVHWPARSFNLLLYDDPVYVSQNWHVAEGLTIESVKWAFTTGYFGNWHPLTWLSLQWDVTAGGGSSSAFHTTNLVLHVATTGLLTFFFLRLTGSIATALIAATLFGIHPMHVESVVWVSERKGLLSTFFLTLSLVAYLYFVDRPNLRRGLLVTVFFTMSLMSKQMGVTLPFLLPLLHWVYPRRCQWSNPAGFSKAWNGVNSRAFRALYFGLTIISAAFALIAFQTQAAAGFLKTNESTSVPGRLATAFTNYGRYLRYYLWPADFSFTFPRSSEGEHAWVVAGVVLAIALAIYIAYRYRTQTPFVSLAIAWYLIAFLPVIGILQVGNQVMAMRYSDWPLIGIHLAVSRAFCLGFESLRGRRPYQVAVFCSVFVLMLFLGQRSRSEAKYWAEDGSLYRRAIEISPQNALAHAMLGQHYLDAGHAELAMSHLQKSIAIFPGNAVAISGLAQLHFDRGDTELAWDFCRKAIALSPQMPQARLLQGLLYANQGDYQDAERIIKALLSAAPHSFLPTFNLASIYRRQGRYQEALEFYDRSLKVNSAHWQSWYYAGQCLESLGDFDGATAAYGKAIAHTSGASLLPLRSFVRIRLVCGSIEHLQAPLFSLEKAESKGKRIPERILFQTFSGSPPARADVNALTESLRNNASEDPFLHEVLGDAHECLGDRKLAEEMWSNADSLWPRDARSTARHYRQSRIDKLAGRRE